MKQKKDIACTLGSGAAFGYAHIGVFKYLEELGITVSGVAGTSMGAIVGGLYAYGYRAKELEELTLGLNRMELAKFFLPTFPRGGIVDSDNVKKFLSSLVGTARIEHLPIPFRSVATDILTGKEVIFDSGPLIDGMIASMSIQGMFNPYHCRGLYLCDGGMSNPLPWNLGNELGHVNIIVNVLPLLGYNQEGKRIVQRISEISADAEQKQENGFLDSIRNGTIFNTAKELINTFKQKKMTVQQLHKAVWGREENHAPSLMEVLMHWTFMTSVERRIPRPVRGVKQVLIEPDMKGFGPFDFRGGKELIERGYRSAREQEQRIKKYTGV